MKALILSCNTGGGHNAAGHAMKEAYERAGHRCDVVDTIALTNQKMSDFVSDAYLNMVNRVPEAFGMAYNLWGNMSSEKRKSPLYYMRKLDSKNILRLVERERYDVIIATPEFDTLKNQIDLKPLFDESFFAMIEGNYDILSILDISKYQNFFHAFNLYQRYREKLTGFSYSDTAYNYDEDGNYVANHSYNRYGDYIVYRRNNEERRVYGVVPAIFNKTHFSAEMIDNFNNAFSVLKNKGVKLIYDYSPRSDLSISEDSSIQSAIELDEYLKANIDMAFISNAEESIIDAYYFYGTDNHLSTEGAKKRTQHVLKNLLPLL